ncbi:flavin monoamine oxidase family protein [Falsiroseomonas ponticola]|uniref:flavin monoamine oxidase family protein n=1 Tax=Falsiroseomonas ponticola TaxID=2786951 RepID=UPI0019319A3A|nr:NAD(P)/FAD-dependent oxidoreductase [Roseomonas ponticola]
MPRLPADPDLLVIGAGAAGIAAARTALEAGHRVVVLEARGRVGGRAVTDTARLGLPYDLGATWLHQAATNPLVPLAQALGVTLHDSDALRRERSQVGARALTAEEDAAYAAAWTAAEARIEAAATDGGPDRSLAEGMGATGPWAPAIEGWQGDIISAAPAGRVSLHDFHANALEGGNRLPEGGFGALVARLAEGLPVVLDAPVTRLAWGGRQAVAEGPFGTLRARAVVVTIPASLLAAEAIRFDPPLPAAVLQAAHDLPLGQVVKAGFRVAGGERFGLPPFSSVDRLVAPGEPLVAMSLFPFGRPVISCHVGGDAAAALEAEGDAAVAAFMRAEIATRFGADALRCLVPGPIVSEWGRDPWSRGVYSYARIGRAAARAILAEPLADGRLCLAGEATDQGMAGTVGGAWRSGVGAGRRAMAALAG